VVLAEDLPDVDGALRIGRQILDALSVPLSIGDRTVTPQASIGIAVSDRDALDPEALLRAADDALYQAKDRGRGRVCLFEGPLDGTDRKGADAGADRSSALTNST
jgi:diguanylate cyclase (GGDEF)-like protein